MMINLANSQVHQMGMTHVLKELRVLKSRLMLRKLVDLQAMHGNENPVEKLNAWAHMIHMGKHNSWDSQICLIIEVLGRLISKKTSFCLKWMQVCVQERELACVLSVST